MESSKDIVDFLVIGSGIAGLAFALDASKLGKVVVISKGNLDEGSTSLAQGGIAAVLPGTDDSFESHIQDTLRTGAGLSKPNIVEKIVRYAPEVIRQLSELGVDFSRRESDEKNPQLGREGGHSKNRIVHVADYTGRAIEDALIAAVKSNPNIEILENYMAVDLLTQHHIPNYSLRPWENIECYGAYVLDIESGEVHTVLAKKTILATGGAGVVYLHTTNQSVSTGDGVAMAYRAGARVANMEFMQFHPTVLYLPGQQSNRSFLISEAVRGEGAILLNSAGERFMPKYHEMLELAPRDVVARAIDTELKKSGDNCVYLDIRSKGANFIIERFPLIYQTCLDNGIDITKDLIPVVPAAHYICGGVMVDEWGRTDIENLYACGETAHTGMHGANRLASNSLLEAFAMAKFALEDIRQRGVNDRKLPDIPQWDDSGVFDRNEWVIIRHNYEMLRALMWDYVGIVRSLSRLSRANERVQAMWVEIDDFYRKNPVRRKIVELRNMTYVADLMIRSAMSRHESRGIHYLVDFPETDTRYSIDTIIRSPGIYRESHIL